MSRLLCPMSSSLMHIDFHNMCVLNHIDTHNDEAKLITRPFSNYNDRVMAIYGEYFNISNKKKKKNYKYAPISAAYGVSQIHIILQRDVEKLRHSFCDCSIRYAVCGMRYTSKIFLIFWISIYIT